MSLRFLQLAVSSLFLLDLVIPGSALPKLERAYGAIRRPAFLSPNAGQRISCLRVLFAYDYIPGWSLCAARLGMRVAVVIFAGRLGSHALR